MPGPEIRLGTHPDRRDAELVTVSGLTKMPGWKYKVTLIHPVGEKPPQVLAVEACAPEGETVRPETFRRIPIGRVLRLAEGSLRNNAMMALVAEDVGAEIGPRPYGGDPQHLH